MSITRTWESLDEKEGLWTLILEIGGVYLIAQRRLYMHIHAYRGEQDWTGNILAAKTYASLEDARAEVGL